MTKNWLILTMVSALILACGMATPTPVLSEVEGPTEEPAEDVVMETEAPTEPPTTEEVIETEVPTELPPTETPITCVELLTPENGVDLPAVGKVTFEWTALEGADSYLLTFTLPSGETVDFETNGTTRDRYMEAFAQAGEYQWNVTALVGDGSQICSSDFFTFTKPTTPANAPQGDGGGDWGGPSGGDGDGGNGGGTN